MELANVNLEADRTAQWLRTDHSRVAVSPAFSKRVAAGKDIIEAVLATIDAQGGPPDRLRQDRLGLDANRRVDVPQYVLS